jgi:transcriptional regulator with XRE-family HTH domain
MNRTVCATLRDRRLALRISQKASAEFLGTSNSILNRVEHGKRRFEEDWLQRLPSAIAAPIVCLLDYQARQEIARRAINQRGGHCRLIRLRPPGWSERQTG